MFAWVKHLKGSRTRSLVRSLARPSIRSSSSEHRQLFGQFYFSTFPIHPFQPIATSSPESIKKVVDHRTTSSATDMIDWSNHNHRHHGNQTTRNEIQEATKKKKKKMGRVKRILFVHKFVHQEQSTHRMEWTQVQLPPPSSSPTMQHVH